MTMSIEQVREELVKVFNMETLSEERRQDLLDTMTETVMKQIFLAIGEKIGDDGADEFDAILAEGDQEKMQVFLSQYIPDPDAFVRSIVVEFHDAMKNGGIPNGE